MVCRREIYYIYINACVSLRPHSFLLLISASLRVSIVNHGRRISILQQAQIRRADRSSSSSSVDSSTHRLLLRSDPIRLSRSLRRPPAVFLQQRSSSYGRDPDRQTEGARDRRSSPQQRRREASPRR